MLVDLKQKSQVTIPKDILIRLGLRTGDKLEIAERDGVIVLTPVMVIPKSQAWFFSKDWQERETTAEQEIERGELHLANNASELISGLGLDTE